MAQLTLPLVGHGHFRLPREISAQAAAELANVPIEQLYGLKKPLRHETGDGYIVVVRFSRKEGRQNRYWVEYERVLPLSA